MTVSLVISLLRQMILTALKVAAPLLGVSLAVGLVVSILQATTQINEQTLTFVPKIVAVLLVGLLLGPWLLQMMIDFSAGLWGNLPSYVR